MPQQPQVVNTPQPRVSVQPMQPMSSPLVPEVRSLEEIEREQIIKTLGHFNGNRAKTAEALGIGVRTLGLKLKKWKEQNLVAQTI